MSKAYWRELLKIWEQWAAVGLAAIPSGILLGFLLQNGTPKRTALAISVPVGLILALCFTAIIRKLSAIGPVRQATVVVQLEGTARDYVYSPTLAVAIIAISLYTFQHGVVHEAGKISTNTPNAIPQL